jgi:hypothetical protein
VDKLRPSPGRGSEGALTRAGVLDVTTAGVEGTAQQGRWLGLWRLTNLTDATMEALESWLPHGRFQAPREAFDPVVSLPPHGGCVVSRIVAITAEPGEVVENAFLNLRVRAGGQEYRVLARMRVLRGDDGSIDAKVDAVTAQPVGFSQETPGAQRAKPA